MSRYAISDVHGCILTLKKALHKINFTKQDELYIIGDMIDRHIGTKGVIDFILQMRNEGYKIECLLGNHESFLLESINEDAIFPLWVYKNGGMPTLISYGCTYTSGYMQPHWSTFIPQSHMDFFNSLPLIVVLDDYVLVHAQLDWRKNDPINETDEDVALWERNSYGIDPKKIGDRMLITGHTITDKQTMEIMVNGGVWGRIDRGCVFSGADYNHLAVLNLDTRQLKYIKNIDMERGEV